MSKNDFESAIRSGKFELPRESFRFQTLFPDWKVET